VSPGAADVPSNDSLEEEMVLTEEEEQRRELQRILREHHLQCLMAARGDQVNAIGEGDFMC